jgi:ribosomal protein S18 acetylase RimI-like enzyme
MRRFGSGRSGVDGRAGRPNWFAAIDWQWQTRPMTRVHVQVAGRAEHLAEAAAIWAAATAARDGDAEIAPLSLARPLIQRVIESSPRSLLLVAVDETEQMVGFAAVEPMSGHESTADIRYLAVQPRSWGGGVAGQLMPALPDLLTAAGFTHGELDVYLDNPRAVKLYERHGWLPHGDATPHPRSGRLEQRYRLDFLAQPRSR